MAEACPNCGAQKNWWEHAQICMDCGYTGTELAMREKLDLPKREGKRVGDPETARLRAAVRELGEALGLAEERLPEWPMGYRQSVRAVLRKHAPLIAECKAEKEKED